jgi:hypothetical protein
MAFFDKTHSIDYEPENLDKDWVTARCGEGVHITSYSPQPQCRDCQRALMREQLEKARGL